MSGQQRPGMTSTLSHASSSTDPAAQGDRRPSNLNAETSAEQRKARRAELRQFYGLKGDNGQGDASPAKRAGDPRDLGVYLRATIRVRLTDWMPRFTCIRCQGILPEPGGYGESQRIDADSHQALSGSVYRRIDHIPDG
jgi:hypothetical protein